MASATKPIGIKLDREYNLLCTNRAIVKVEDLTDKDISAIGPDWALLRPSLKTLAACLHAFTYHEGNRRPIAFERAVDLVTPERRAEIHEAVVAAFIESLPDDMRKRFEAAAEEDAEPAAQEATGDSGEASGPEPA